MVSQPCKNVPLEDVTKKDSREAVAPAFGHFPIFLYVNLVYLNNLSIKLYQILEKIQLINRFLTDGPGVGAACGREEEGCDAGGSPGVQPLPDVLRCQPSLSLI